MRKKIFSIEIGCTFERLTILKRDKAKRGKNSYYLCECSCGNVKSVMRGNLLSGQTMSCGCLQKERAAKLKKQAAKNITNFRFGKLFVLHRGQNTVKNQAQWWCRCDCGNEKLMEGSSLRSGNSASCGCARADTMRSRPSQAKDLVGQKFGLLTVMSRGYNDKRKNAQWWCLCACGGGALKKGNPLRSGKIKSCGCLELENRLRNCSKRKVSHGLYKHPLYKVFQGIKARCYNKNNRSYMTYGGRGISICKEWLDHPEDFIKWALYNGWEPDKDLDIDRINNNGNYCPENCQVILHVENALKKFTDKEQGLVIAGSAINIRELKSASESTPAPKTMKKLARAGLSLEDILAYGKLPHYQKLKFSKALSNGSPISIATARKIKRKHAIRTRPLGYISYRGMMGRCNNPKDPAYPRYGGRGIKVCAAWHKNFKQFEQDMGPPPHPDAAIHRINNDGNYEPSNCEWVSRSENTRAMHTSE